MQRVVRAGLEPGISGFYIVVLCVSSAQKRRKPFAHNEMYSVRNKHKRSIKLKWRYHKIHVVQSHSLETLPEVEKLQTLINNYLIHEIPAIYMCLPTFHFTELVLQMLGHFFRNKRESH